MTDDKKVSKRPARPEEWNPDAAPNRERYTARKASEKVTRTPRDD